MNEMTKEERALHRMDVEDWKASRAELAATKARLGEAERLLKEVLGGLDCPIPMARPIAEFLRTAASASGGA